MRLSKIQKLIRVIVFLPWSIFFNFYYLPFRKAWKLPIMFYVCPTFIQLKGKVIIEAPMIRFNMIQLGKIVAPIVSDKSLRWFNRGTIIFKGGCVISNNSFVSCGKDSVIRFGDHVGFNCGCRIISEKEIAFGDKVRVSWNCTFIDSDYHPLIDMVRHKPLSVSQSIKIGKGCWIGHDCIISKGVRMANNITVSSGSVVKGRFNQENTIIGGNLAMLLDEGFIRDDLYQEHRRG